ncbi:hypothetical protein DRN98_09575, partial [Methanosarcinales archaeon]
VHTCDRPDRVDFNLLPFLFDETPEIRESAAALLSEINGEQSEAVLRILIHAGEGNREVLYTIIGFSVFRCEAI